MRATLFSPSILYDAFYFGSPFYGILKSAHKSGAMTKAIYKPLLSSESDFIALIMTVALLSTLAIVGIIHSAYFSYEKYRSRYSMLLCCLVREEEGHCLAFASSPDARGDIEMQSNCTALPTARLLEASTMMKVKSLSVDSILQSETQSESRKFTV